jgi:hypothetical protein
VAKSFACFRKPDMPLMIEIVLSSSSMIVVLMC